MLELAMKTVWLKLSPNRGSYLGTPGFLQAVRVGDTGVNPPINFEQRVVSTRPENLRPVLSIDV